MPLLTIIDPHAFNRGWLGGTQWYFQMATALNQLGWDMAVVAARNKGKGPKEVDSLFPGRVFRTPFGTIPRPVNFKFARHAWRLARRRLGRPPEEDRWAELLVNWKGRGADDVPMQSADVLCAVTYHYWGVPLAVRSLSSQFGTPYWIDIHDPMKWTNIPGTMPSEDLLTAYKDAAQIVTTTATYAERLKELVPEIANRVNCLRLTHNQPNLLESPAAPEDPTVRFLYMGYLYGLPTRSAVPLLRAMAAVLAGQPEARGRLILRLVGQGPGVPEAKRVAHELGLEDCLECTPQVPPERLRDYLITSDILCLFMPAANPQLYQVPGKTWDYLFSNKPILAVVPPGEIADLVEDTKSGYVVHPDDTQGLSQVLSGLLARKQASGSVEIHRDPERLRPYTYEAFRETLASILAACGKQEKDT